MMFVIRGPPYNRLPGFVFTDGKGGFSSWQNAHMQSQLSDDQRGYTGFPSYYTHPQPPIMTSYHHPDDPLANPQLGQGPSSPAESNGRRRSANTWSVSHKHRSDGTTGLSTYTLESDFYGGYAEDSASPETHKHDAVVDDQSEITRRRFTLNRPEVAGPSEETGDPRLDEDAIAQIRTRRAAFAAGQVDSHTSEVTLRDDQDYSRRILK
ncbi:uncharacterized protein EI90DRAFT_177406 [Cantharellus anzutake]|uniref:uncharacterized protein n=1 Tax=Cantharellus anzutake TaxID=1750568 RepID=UPI001903C28A|nr:uncharacterized protein EI90DRAFT_177406 [Cantharellus anzutake]KAF8336453.1 hypothetical protein EI90DRAFT_177406 [Cantharellus anzutake]